MRDRWMQFLFGSPKRTLILTAILAAIVLVAVPGFLSNLLWRVLNAWGPQLVLIGLILAFLGWATKWFWPKKGKKKTDS